MESGRKTEEEREKGEANNSLVSCDVLSKDIFNLLGFIERLKNEADQIDLDMDKIEKLKLELTFMSTFLQLSNSNLDGFNAKMSLRAQEVDDLVQSVFYPSGNSMLVKYEMDRVVPRVIENIKSCISTHHHSSSSANMTEEQLLELLDLLLVNLCNLPQCCPELIFPLMTQYEIIRNVCGNIRDFHRLKVNGCIEPEIVEYVFPQVQLMAERVGHFCFVLLADQLDVPQLNFKLIHLLVKIIPVQLEVILICSRNLKASELEEVSCFIKQLIRTSPCILREYLIHLKEHIVNVVTTSNSSRNIHVMIEFLLIILTDVPNDFIHHDKLFDLLARVGTLTREVSIYVRNLEVKSMSEENTSETSYVTLDLLENIELLKRDLKYVYLKAPDPYTLCFPMSDGLVFMTLLLRELHDLLSSNASSVALIKEEIVHVKKDLKFISSFLNAKQALNNDMRTQVLDVAYEAEHAINSILVRDHGLSHLVFLLPDTIKKIKLIITELQQTSEKLVEVAADISNKVKKTSKSSIYGNIIVGFKEETNMIIRHLTSGPADLDVISIIGGAGSGKTTLAYRVYNDREVTNHFDIRAWCTVDQEYDKEKVWQKIYNQVSGSEAKFSEDKYVDDELRKKLFGKRYLIVLDDLWDTADFDDISRPFPKLENGSRIILTSRNYEVALHGKRHTDPLNLRLLRPEESWELLEKMIFGEESCPEELKYVGEEIARKCEGLPLVVDVIGGVLARKEREEVLWLEVLHNFKSYKNEEVLMKVTGLSYDSLPDNLKLCLLYLASYPKEKNIKISELKILWSAEGLVETTAIHSEEEAMEVSLDKLISSNLVKVFNKRGGSWEATCFVDNLVHDFCLMKARKEKLFDFISSSAPSSSSSSDLAPRGMSIHWNENCVMFNPEKKNQYAKRLRSLRVYDVQYWKHNHLSYNCHLRHLRLLKSLDLRKIRLTDSLLNEICMLVHLKYLNIQMKAKALPPSFSNLWNLETLVVDNRRSRMVLSPTIWSLAKLRHVSMDNCSVFDSDTAECKASKLENLRILNGLSLSCSEDTEDIFKRFPNLRSLTFSIREQWPCSAEEIDFPRLDVLDELLEVWAYFYCAWPNKHTHLCDFHFPSSLRRLNLTRFNLTSNSLSTIGRLPYLEELSLSEAIIQGKKWDMDDEGSFEYLRFLRLDKVSFSEWKLNEEGYSFPQLNELHIQRCDELRHIPEDFVAICSLKCISLWRNPQLEGSALMIKRDFEDMCGEDCLEVILVPYAKSPYKVDI